MWLQLPRHHATATTWPPGHPRSAAAATLENRSSRCRCAGTCCTSSCGCWSSPPAEKKRRPHRGRTPCDTAVEGETPKRLQMKGENRTTLGRGGKTFGVVSSPRDRCPNLRCVTETRSNHRRTDKLVVAACGHTHPSGMYHAYKAQTLTREPGMHRRCSCTRESLVSSNFLAVPRRQKNTAVTCLEPTRE